jgi:hypothetical protein
MAKRSVSGVNKTQAVAEYLKANPKAKAREIAEALDKKGIDITPGHVANIKSKIKRLRLAKKAAKTPVAEAASPAPAEAQPAAKAGEALTLQHVKVVAQTVKTIGGFDRLKELLEVVREVGGLKKFRDLLEAMAATEIDAP